MNKFSGLFQPGNIGGRRLENRIMMPGMGNTLVDEEEKVTKRMRDYYLPRAKGGVGLYNKHNAVNKHDCHQ